MDRQSITFIGENEFTFPFGELIARAVIDEDAPSRVEAVVRQLGGTFLEFVLKQHQHPDGRTVIVRDHINLALFLEDADQRIHGLIFAELEAENRLARLHVLYVPPAFRRNGLAKAVLACFDDVLGATGYESVVLAPVNHRSKSIFCVHQQESPLEYLLYSTDEATLRFGDSQMD